jgi:phosphoglycerate kinase
MGLFENGMFANGTINIAKSMALAFWRGCKTLIGGGDTLEAMRKAEVSEGEVSHVSTGGELPFDFSARCTGQYVDVCMQVFTLL